jgi:hypothetical protein
LQFSRLVWSPWLSAWIYSLSHEIPIRRKSLRYKKNWLLARTTGSTTGVSSACCWIDKLPEINCKTKIYCFQFVHFFKISVLNLLFLNRFCVPFILFIFHLMILYFFAKHFKTDCWDLRRRPEHVLWSYFLPYTITYSKLLIWFT